MCKVSPPQPAPQQSKFSPADYYFDVKNAPNPLALNINCNSGVTALQSRSVLSDPLFILCSLLTLLLLFLANATTATK